MANNTSDEIKNAIATHGFYAVMPKGTSMLPLIVEGHDTVIISGVNGKLKKYDVALYQRANGALVLHRAVRIKKDGYTFCGDHQYIFEYGVTDEQIIGVMTALYKDGTEFDLNSKKYQHEVKRRVFLMPVKRFYHGIFDLLGIHPTLKKK